MNSALEYMTDLHTTLANDYRTPDGRYSESFGLIAVNITKRLLEEGKIPAILRIKGEPIRRGIWIGNRTLVPQMYGGRVEWGTHLFCFHDEQVYDPILEGPVSIKDYVSLVFGDGNFLISVAVSPEEIEEFVERTEAKKMREDVLYDTSI